MIALERLWRQRNRLTPSKRKSDRKRAIAALGRPLSRTQHIHHHTDTQIVICDSPAYHLLLHDREVVLARGGDPNTQTYSGYRENCLKSRFRVNLHDWIRSKTGRWWDVKGTILGRLGMTPSDTEIRNWPREAPMGG